MDKACNADIDQTWIDWALEMMQVGYESDNLYQLAGISKPYNQFELQDLTNSVLNDLNLDFSDKKKTIRNYAYFLVSSNIDKPKSYTKILKTIGDIYYELDMDIEYRNFALLNWAKDDLEYDTYQHYWDGADRNNIDTIIKEQFVLFMKKIEKEI